MSSTRSVTASAARASTPVTSGSSMITAAEVVVVPQVVGDLGEHPLHAGQVLAVRDADVDHGPRPVLAHVADPQDLAVGDVPDRAVQGAQPRHPQADRLDRAGGLADVDHVADAVLVLEDHEDAGEEVLDQASGRRSRGRGRGCRRWR